MTASDLIVALKKAFEEGIPFVAYRKPGASGINYLIQDDDAVHRTTSFKETGFVFSPFDKKQEAFLIPGTPLESKLFDKENFKPNTNLNTQEREEERDAHIALVERAVTEIKTGSLKKVVLSRKQKIPLDQTDPFVLFEKLLSSYPNAFVYIWSHPETGTWLGATPETLLALTGNRFETMALAGTQQYDGTTDVSWGIKEQEEQELVTREITSKLREFDLSSFTLHDRETYRAGSLLHLRTRITGSFAPGTQKLAALLNALHPTPAVCGLPRDLAKDFIKTYENYDRAYYTGFLGEINVLSDTSRRRSKANVENLVYKTLKHTTRLFVNLRCMQYCGTAGFIYVGGGITKDSIPENEWQETVNKAQTIASIL